MAAEVETALGHRLWGIMLAHVLTGSTGPKVAALVSEYHLPHYGALESWGFTRVKQALRLIRTESGEGDIGT
jgi:hypothetical protein